MFLRSLTPAIARRRGHLVDTTVDVLGRLVHSVDLPLPRSILEEHERARDANGAVTMKGAA
jgi:hypothetical protein